MSGPIEGFCFDGIVRGVTVDSNGNLVKTGLGAAKGYQQITSLSAAAALTVPTGASYAVVQAEAQPVRWRDDGTNPTTSVGMVLAAGAERVFMNLAALRFIETAASGKLNVSYYA